MFYRKALRKRRQPHMAAKANIHAFPPHQVDKHATKKSCKTSSEFRLPLATHPKGGHKEQDNGQQPSNMATGRLPSPNDPKSQGAWQ